MCGGFVNSAEHKVTFSPDELIKGLEAIFDGFDVRDDIQPDIFRETLRLFNLAAAKGISESHDEDAVTDEFLEQIKHNNEVFSAFRTHRMQNDIAAQLIDADGHLKSWDKFRRDVAPLTGKYCKTWLNTEYNTAIIRAHRAADWKHFVNEQDVYPNLRWMPTTSATPDPVHETFWSKKLTLSVNDPFWGHHHPGERWGCKCTCEQTDDPVNDLGLSEAPKDTASKGLKGNPGETGQLFSEDHPYIAKAYAGAENAVKSNITQLKRKRTTEQEEDIRTRWAKRKEIILLSKEWANSIPSGAMRTDAETAARIMLRTFGKDYGLPRIKLENFGGKTKRGLVLANYNADADILRVNSNKAATKEYAELSEKAVGWGWSSQRNTILHELSHRVHSKFDTNYSNRRQETPALDRKYIKKNLSEYAAQDKAEYEAELISGILSGKKYPDRIIAQSAFAIDKGNIGRILVTKGRDMSPEAVIARRAENKALAKDLEIWYKENLPETTIGKMSAKRFIVENMYGETIIVNKTFYKEIVSKYKDDLFYCERLEKAKIAHNLIKDAKYVRTETPLHEKHATEVFKVYERTYGDVVYELKIKVTSDEQFLYYMKIK